MRTGLIALGFVFVSSVAGAQGLTPLQTYVLAAVADNASTIQFIANDTGHEANPLINRIDNPKVMLAVGAAADVAATVTWIHVTKNHPKLQAIGLYSVAALRIALAINNVSLDYHNRNHGNVPFPYTADRRRLAFSLSTSF
jgi:hypothetical protein